MEGMIDSKIKDIKLIANCKNAFEGLVINLNRYSYILCLECISRCNMAVLTAIVKELFACRIIKMQHQH